MEVFKEIPVDLIDPSPYQHRRSFSGKKLAELANSIKRDGLIEPIIARSKNGRYELIAGERRWRAVEMAGGPSILSRIVEVSDLQARRMCAAENLQREDLSAEEQIKAIVEIIDAELIEDELYQLYGDDPITRVTRLLKKMVSAERHGYVNSVGKFADRIDIIFDSLPKPKRWDSFLRHDLPFLGKIDEDVKDLASRIKSSRAKTEALQKLKEQAPDVFGKIDRAIENDEDADNVTVQVGILSSDTVTLSDASSNEIKKAADIVIGKAVDSSVSVHFSSDTPEWYTPHRIVQRVVSVLNQISLDPCSNNLVKPNVPAAKHYTKEHDGLSQPWGGKVFMNPPYGDEIINWVRKLKNEYETGGVTEAIALVPARTDTEWFRLLREYAKCFISGRLKFNDALVSAPFPSVSIYLGSDIERFVKMFGDIGDIYVLWGERG